MSDALITSDETIEAVSTETPQVNVPEKRCTGTCGRTLPLTTEHFIRRGENWLSLCRVCYTASIQSGRARSQANHEDEPIPTERLCKGCKKTLPLTPEHFERPAHGFRSVCRECEKEKDHRRRVAAKSIRTEDGVPIEKYCIGCERTLPLTTEHFYPHKGHGWMGPCKTCRLNSSTSPKKMDQIRDNVTERLCIGCERTLPLTTEHFVSINGGWHRKCRACEKAPLLTSQKNWKIEKARGTPDQCGSCGTDKGNILGDINTTTHERYGYLCARCYRMLLACQKDVPRIRKVLAYLELTHPHQVY